MIVMKSPIQKGKEKLVYKGFKIHEEEGIPRSM